MIQTIKKSLVGGLVFSFTALGVFVVYALVGSTWTNPDNLQVGAGSGLSANSWNQMLANMNNLNDRVSNIKSETFYIKSSDATVKCINVNYAPAGYVDDDCIWLWNGYSYYESKTQDNFPSYTDSNCTTLYRNRGMHDVYHSDKLNVNAYIKMPVATGLSNVLQCTKGNINTSISY